MPRQPVNQNLIVDVGMSEGNDTAFYLRKGFRVVGIEADPMMAASLADRFAGSIAEGRLTVLNRAAADVSGAEVVFYHNARWQGLSGLAPTAQAALREGQTEHRVRTIAWRDIVAVAGVPRYCKIDIEGGEATFLKSVHGSDALPDYVSVEVHAFDPIAALYGAGYRYFKFVNQTMLGTLAGALPNPPLEGLHVPDPDWNHASGPFGRELPDAWQSFREACVTYEMIQRLKVHLTILGGCWFDCHAAIDPGA
jgi:FkbM family methyltransferase